MFLKLLLYFTGLGKGSAPSSLSLLPDFRSFPPTCSLPYPRLLFLVYTLAVMYKEAFLNTPHLTLQHQFFPTSQIPPSPLHSTALFSSLQHRFLVHSLQNSVVTHSVIGLQPAITPNRLCRPEIFYQRNNFSVLSCLVQEILCAMAQLHSLILIVRVIGQHDNNG